jgi:hypothetical protein
MPIRHRTPSLKARRVLPHSNNNSSSSLLPTASSTPTTTHQHHPIFSHLLRTEMDIMQNLPHHTVAAVLRCPKFGQFGMIVYHQRAMGIRTNSNSISHNSSKLRLKQVALLEEPHRRRLRLLLPSPLPAKERKRRVLRELESGKRKITLPRRSRHLTRTERGWTTITIDDLHHRVG